MQLKRLIYLLMPLILVSCGQGTQKTTEQTVETDKEIPGLYGEMINTQNPVSGTELLQLLDEQDSVWVTFRSLIVTNCQRTGCWMDLDIGDDKVLKVFFKDYEFFIPMDSQGKMATIEGYATKEIVDVEMLRHYAEDDGKSQEEIDAITEPMLLYMFDAIGVIIEE